MPLESTRPWEINTCATSCNVTPNNPASHYLGPIRFHLTNRQSGGKIYNLRITRAHLHSQSSHILTDMLTHSHMHSHGHTHSTWTGCNGPRYSLGMSWVQIHSIIGAHIRTHTHSHSFYTHEAKLEMYMIF